MKHQNHRDYTKFFTPNEIADFMAELLDLDEGSRLIDPHAGNGQLVRAARKRYGNRIEVDAVEINENFLRDLEPHCNRVFINDFLDHTITGEYDACIDNPPFGNDTDLRAHFDHVREMVKLGGTIAMIVPDDFNPLTSHESKRINNWSSNSDGTTTPIKIIRFKNN